MAFIATQIYVCRTRLNASVCGIRLFYDFIVCMHIKMTAMCAHFMHFCKKNMDNKKWSREMPIPRVAEYRSYVKSIPIHQGLAKRSGEVKWTTEWTARQIEWTVEKSTKFQRSWFSSFPTAVHKWKLHKNTPKLFFFGIFEGKKKQKHFFHAFVSIQEFSGWNGNSVGLIGKWRKFYYPLHMIICIQSILCVVIQKI